MRALLRNWLCYQNDSMSLVAPPASVEGPLEAFLALALVLLHGLARRADLVEQDARHRRKRGAVEPPLGVPEPGAPEGLWAVEEALLHLDADGDQGALVVGPHRLEELVVADDPCAPVHTERFLAARDEEDRPDVRVLEEVPHPVQPPVARPVRDHEVAVVEDADEARRVALGRDVASPPRAPRSQEEEGRPRDEGAAGARGDGDGLLDPPVPRP